MTASQVLVLLMCGTGHALGCVCTAHLTPKQDWQQSSLVFIGRVESVSPEFDIKRPFRKQVATVRVDEAFKGAEKGQLIRINQTGSDCELRYSKGWRRLLYLGDGSKDGVWSSPGCDRSSDPVNTADDLKFLRALPQSAERTRISGDVLVRGSPPQRLAGVTLTIRGSQSSSISVATDSQGSFEVYDLPRGTYEVSISVPG